MDFFLVFPAYLALLVLRVGGEVPDRFWVNFWRLIWIIAAIHVLTNHRFGLYGQMWRYASVYEARQVVLASLAAGLCIFLAGTVLWPGDQPLPLSILIFGPLLSLMGFGAIRFHSRLFAFKRLSTVKRRTRVLLVGAGEAGATVLKDIRRNPSLGIDPVAIVDDDRRKLGLALNGVRVRGNRSDIPSLVKALDVDQVFLTIPSAMSELVRDVATLCEEGEVTLRVLPSMRDSVDGRVTVRDVRDLRIEDLLGRQQVQTDLQAVGATLRGRRVLITGAGGSIGSEIVRQVLAFGPAALVMLDHDETHMHEVITELGEAPFVETALADIRDRARMAELFMKHRPEAVFHAAAHKHVHLLESNPEEAVLNNIIGTANVADAAAAVNVNRFVLISTDKAIRPISVMGASKWFSEQIVRSLHWNDCVFCAVRFGNVLGSRGSVIPTFFRQMAHGGPITVTDASMARYFMSVEEAVQLVLQASALSRGGEVFTLDMGEPMNILDLARKLIRLSGRVPNKDVEIAIVGPRPGEKIVEDILDVDEESVTSGHPAIVAARPPLPDGGALRRALRELEVMALEGRGEELSVLLKSLAREHLTVREEIRL